MEVDVREFLSGFSVEELETLGILHPGSRGQRWLRAQSVNPLIQLMQEHNVTSLMHDARHWSFAVDGAFANPNSPTGEAKQGQVWDLRNPGGVFNLQNRYINPYFQSEVDPLNEEDEPSGNRSTDSSQPGFSLERDLQSALRANIEQLEFGLRIIDGGAEKTVDAGRIDITAKDAEDRLVVIEIKAGTSQLRDIAQLLSYMGSIDNDEGSVIRGILVANDFDDRLVLAAQAVPNISLKAYSFSFSFEDR